MSPTTPPGTTPTTRARRSSSPPHDSGSAAEKTHRVETPVLPGTRPPLPVPSRLPAWATFRPPRARRPKIRETAFHRSRGCDGRGIHRLRGSGLGKFIRLATERHGPPSDNVSTRKRSVHRKGRDHRTGRGAFRDPPIRETTPGRFCTPRKIHGRGSGQHAGGNGREGRRGGTPRAAVRRAAQPLAVTALRT